MWKAAAALRLRGWERAGGAAQRKYSPWVAARRPAFWPFQPSRRAQAAKIGVLWRVSARFSLQSSNLQYNIVVVVCFKSPFLYIGTITQHCSTFHL